MTELVVFGTGQANVEAKLECCTKRGRVAQTKANIWQSRLEQLEA